mgnify:CR=1 FL=1
MSRPTVHRLDYRLRVQMLSWAAGLAEKVSDLGTIDDVDGILATARKRTGLADFGDPSFMEPLRKVVGYASEVEGFTPLSRVIQRQAWNQAAQNRLLFTDYLKKHPQVLDIPVERPIFVLGFPRTGTTLVQHLLAQEPSRRGLHMWELVHPVPTLPDPAADARRGIRQMKAILYGAYQLAPEMGEVHYVDATTYEECWYLFANSFAVLNWDLQSGLRRYGDWLTTEHDMRQAYREYKAYLQIRLSQQPCKQLVLKCPEHLWFIDALLDVFPDACIVWTHRDPFPTIASYCSLMSMQWRNLYGEIPTKRLGEHMTYRLHQGVEKALEARDRHGADRFFDVRFGELVRDPLAMMEQIHDHFDLGWTDNDRARGQEWLDDERDDARGKHRYDPDLYGLHRDTIHERFATYIDRIGVDTHVRPPAEAS